MPLKLMFVRSVDSWDTWDGKCLVFSLFELVILTSEMYQCTTGFAQAWKVLEFRGLS